MFNKQMTEASLTGNLWYSAKQYKFLRDKGRDRTFAKMADGKIVEYTELISFEDLQEEPGRICPIDDAKFLGTGSFHHFMDASGREW
jgi:hypothetical protein